MPTAATGGADAASIERTSEATQVHDACAPDAFGANQLPIIESLRHRA